jgi:vacuolar-type H+-ATPase subunit H
MILLTTCLLAFAIGCSRDEAEDKMADAAAKAEKGAHDMMDHAGAAAGSMANEAKQTASNMAGNVAGDAVAACRRLAESGAWDQALEVCKKAHEMMPDDLGLEHAYQQAQAAASN